MTEDSKLLLLSLISSTFFSLFAIDFIWSATICFSFDFTFFSFSYSLRIVFSKSLQNESSLLKTFLCKLNCAKVGKTKFEHLSKNDK